MREIKLQTARRRRKKIRALERAAEIWVIRILLLAIVFLICCFILAGVSRLINKKPKMQEVVFTGARVVEEETPVVEPDQTIIVVDAGHGGYDKGTNSGDVAEKDICLAVAKKIAWKLENAGIHVIMTREDDTKIGLNTRADIANEADADVFVSIHCNSYDKDSGVNGMECYYSKNSDTGKGLAETIVKQFEDQDRVTNRGTRTADYRVITRATMPAVLMEIGFITNYQERQNMIDEEYQDFMAQRICNGLLEYCSDETESETEPESE